MNYMMRMDDVLMNTNVMSAIAEPSRLQIIELLRDNPLTVGEIAERLQIRQPQASKHVRVLSEAGVVQVLAVANRRICSLSPDPFREMDAWLESYRHLWEERFDRLDAEVTIRRVVKYDELELEFDKPDGIQS